MSYVGIEKLGLILVLLVSLLITYRLRRLYPSELLPQFGRLEKIVSVALITAHILVMAVVLSPLVAKTVVNGYPFYQFTGINDFYKHLYTLTAILQSGLPATHPYYPPASQSFYYGYYLLPAALSHVASIPYNWMMFIFPLATTALVLGFLYQISKNWLSTPLLRLLSLGILLLGTGLDILPTIKLNNPEINHIESWSQELQLGLIVNNTFMSFLWVPHHVLAAMVLIFITLPYWMSKKTNWVITTIGMVYVSLTSLFVALTSGLWWIIIFLLHPQYRTSLIKSGILTLLLLYPYISHLSDRESLFTAYTPGFYRFVSELDILNRLLNLIVEYGPITFLSILILLKINAAKLYKLAIFSAAFLPIIIAWFIRTPGPNDFGMRSILPVQLLLPIAIALLIQTTKNHYVKSLFLLILGLNLFVSGYGYVFEHLNSWRDRRILNLQESSVVHWARSLPPATRLASYQKYDWAFYLPPLGFKTNLTPHLFDSVVYVAGEQGLSHAIFEHLGQNIFKLASSGDTFTEVINTRYASWQDLHKYFSWHPFDYFILTTNEWVKKGTNPWPLIFTSMGMTPQYFGINMAAFTYSDLNTFTSSFAVNINKSQYISPNLDRTISLKPGIWYIIVCGIKKTHNVKVEFPQYYALIDVLNHPQDCVGQIFVSVDTDPIHFSADSHISNLRAYPVVVQPK